MTEAQALFITAVVLLAVYVALMVRIEDTPAPRHRRRLRDRLRWWR